MGDNDGILTILWKNGLSFDGLYKIHWRNDLPPLMYMLFRMGSDALHGEPYLNS